MSPRSTELLGSTCLEHSLMTSFHTCIWSMQVSALSQTHQLQLKIKGKRVEFSHEHLMEWYGMHINACHQHGQNPKHASTPACLWHASAWCRWHWKNLTTSATKKEQIFRWLEPVPNLEHSDSILGCIFIQFGHLVVDSYLFACCVLLCWRPQ